MIPFAKGCLYSLIVLLLPALIGASRPPSDEPTQPLLLLYTNDTSGYLEPCGCSAGVRGGFARRATAVKQIRAQNPDAILVDSGNLANERHRVAVLLEAMKSLDYEVVGLGIAELLLEEEFFRAAQEKGTPLVASAPRPDSVPDGVPKTITRSVGRWKIGFACLTPLSNRWDVEQIAERLSPCLRELRTQCDLVVLLSQLGLKRDELLAKALPGQIDLVIGNSHAQVLTEPKKVDRTCLVPTSSEGQQLGLVEIVFTAVGPQFTQRFITLDKSVVDDAEMVRLIDDYRKQETKGLAEMSVVQPATTSVPADPDELVQAEYISAPRCSLCHEAAFRTWQQQRHAHALETLQKKKRLVGDCLPCHSEHFRRTRKLPPNLTVTPSQLKELTPTSPSPLAGGVQCSTCHGDGVLHSLLGTKSEIIKSPEEKICRKCHEGQHDPDFAFAEDKEKIRHW